MSHQVPLAKFWPDDPSKHRFDSGKVKVEVREGDVFTFSLSMSLEFESGYVRLGALMWLLVDVDGSSLPTLMAT